MFSNIFPSFSGWFHMFWPLYNLYCVSNCCIVYLQFPLLIFMISVYISVASLFKNHFKKLDFSLKNKCFKSYINHLFKKFTEKCLVSKFRALFSEYNGFKSNWCVKKKILRVSVTCYFNAKLSVTPQKSGYGKIRKGLKHF